MMERKGGGIGDFGDSTVVTIAHRIDSLVESDVVVVMGEGKVQECGEGKLLKDVGGGVFAGMLKEQRNA